MTSSNLFYLKPCPFCGGEAHLVSEEPLRVVDGFKVVQCKKCEARGQKVWFNRQLRRAQPEHEKAKELAAVNRWNQRNHFQQILDD